jgi:uncharacterized protein (DUF488 family)
MKVFTLGYQGLDLGAYIRELVKVGVGTVLDVRETAWSNRPDFVKSSLQQGLDAAHINYVHVRRAGNPSRIRKAAKSSEECLSEYRRYLGGNLAAADELYSFVRMASERGRPACLLCYERNPRECHRSVLVERLLELDGSTRPIHLPFKSSTELLPFESPLPRHESLLKSAYIRHGLLPSAE